MWNLINKHVNHYKENRKKYEERKGNEKSDLFFSTQKIIEEITKDFDVTHSFNTAVSHLMKLSNEISSINEENPIYISQDYSDSIRVKKKNYFLF